MSTLPFNQDTLDALNRVPTSLPTVGELWGIGPEDAVQALALVTWSLDENFYFAVPVIPVSGWATPDELILPDDILGVEGTVVLNAETGFPANLFQRRIAPVITDREALELRQAMHNSQEMPTPLPRGDKEHSAESVQWLDTILEAFRAIAFS